MRPLFRVVLLMLFVRVSLVAASAQDRSARLDHCPHPGPQSPGFVQSNGILNLNMTLQNALGTDGFMHYCYVYLYQGQQSKRRRCVSILAISST